MGIAEFLRELTYNPRVSSSNTFIGLGSNLDDPETQIELALGLLEQHRVSIVELSGLYRSEPVHAPAGPWFLNGVAQVSSPHDPRELLGICQIIEYVQGRRRGVHHGPRTIDLDLLLVGDTILETPELTVPHPDLHLRRFVLIPLVEIAPALVHPRLGLSMTELLQRCPDTSLVVRVGSPVMR